MLELNKIYNCNCVDGLKSLDDSSIDMVVTSPPYSDLRSYNGVMNDSVWSFNIFKEIVNELYRVLKDGGVVVWVVNDKTENGGKSLVSFRQALYFQEVGFNVNDVMVWEKLNPMPVVKQPRYNDVFEYMFVFSKGKVKTFNPIMVPCKCAGKEYNSTTKNMGGESGRTYKEFSINKEKVKGNIWGYAVASNKNRGGHPAVFPLSLVMDHIKSWSNEGDVVLDPFMGSGTTAQGALLLNRKYIGFEINEEYVKMAEDNIENERYN